MIKKIKITEVSEFSIWSYTQNRKFGNLEKFFFTSKFDTGCISRFKTTRNGLRQKLEGYDDEKIRITQVSEFSVGPQSWTDTASNSRFKTEPCSNSQLFNNGSTNFLFFLFV